MGQGKIIKFSIGGIPVESMVGSSVDLEGAVKILGDICNTHIESMLTGWVESSGILRPPVVHNTTHTGHAGNTSFTWEFVAPSRPVPDDPSIIEGRCRIIEDDEPQGLLPAPGEPDAS